MLPGVLLHAAFHTIPWRYFERHIMPGGPNVRALLICIPTVRNLEYIINRLNRGGNPTTAQWFNAVAMRDLSNLWFLWQLLLLSGLFLVLARLGLRFRHHL